MRVVDEDAVAGAVAAGQVLRVDRTHDLPAGRPAADDVVRGARHLVHLLVPDECAVPAHIPYSVLLPTARRATVDQGRHLKLQVATAAADVAPHVQRAAVRGGDGDLVIRVVDDVVPDPHIAVGALALDAVVPAFADAIPVDVRVLVREAGVAEVVVAADSIVEVVRGVGEHLIVADDVVAGRVLQEYGVRPRRVSAEQLDLGPRFRPAIAGGGRMMDAVALDSHSRKIGVGPPRAYRRLGGDAEIVHSGNGIHLRAPPVADVAVLDHQVVAVTPDVDSVDARARQREPADDDMVGPRGDVDVVVVLVADRNSALRPRRRSVEHVSVRRARLFDLVG